MSIRVENLTKIYGIQKAIDSISFEVKQGEVLGFLGPNGAGKTTTMRIITCFISPTSGVVYLDGVSIFDDPNNVKRKIGYLPEDNPLYPDMYVMDYLKFVAEIQGLEKSKIPSQIREMINFCGLSDEKHKKIGELSKGYRQRVGLAQALIHDPDFLILDEPTVGLDPNQIVEIRKLIKALGQRKTIILCSHILSEVEATCSRILIINKGKIVADGSPSTLRQQAQGKEVLTIQIEAPDYNVVFKEILDLPTVEMVQPIEDKVGSYRIQSKPNMSSRKAIYELCVNRNWNLLELKGIQTRLEDIFRELTT